MVEIIVWLHGIGKDPSETEKKKNGDGEKE